MNTLVVKQFSLWLGLGVGITAVLAGLIMAFGGPVAAIAVIIALVAGYLVLKDMSIGFWSVIGIICLLPFATIPVDIGVTPTLLDIALGATVGIWAFRVAIGRRREIAVSPVTLPVVAFLIVAIFAFIFGMGNGPLTPNLLRHFAEFLLSIGFSLVVIDYFSSWRRIENAVRVIMLTGGAAAVIGIALWLQPDLVANDLLNVLQRVGYPGGFVIRYIEENPELSERAIGTAVDPNAYGGLLLMLGIISGPQLAAKKPLLPRWLVLGIVFAIFVALVLTFSRGAMFGLVMGLMLVVIARYRNLLPYLVVIGLLFIVMPVSQAYILRFIEGVRGEDLATQMRFGEYRDAIELIARYPIFGVGFSGSPDIDLYLGVASIYLTIGQQMGFLGLIALLAVIAVLFGYAFKNRRYFRGSEQMDPVWLGLHAALFGGLSAGILDHYLVNIDFHHAVTLFWFITGLAVASTRVGVAYAQERKGLTAGASLAEIGSV